MSLYYYNQFQNCPEYIKEYFIDEDGIPFVTPDTIIYFNQSGASTTLDDLDDVEGDEEF